MKAEQVLNLQYKLDRREIPAFHWTDTETITRAMDAHAAQLAKEFMDFSYYVERVIPSSDTNWMILRYNGKYVTTDQLWEIFLKKKEDERSKSKDTDGSV